MFPTRFPHTRETPTSSSSSSSLFEASKTVSTVSVARISTASDPRHFATGDARVKFARKQEGHLATSPFSLPRTGSGSRRKEIAGNDQTRNGNSEASKRKGGREGGRIVLEDYCSLKLVALEEGKSVRTPNFYISIVASFSRN